jgi:hypothetical protein
MWTAHCKSRRVRQESDSDCGFGELFQRLICALSAGAVFLAERSCFERLAATSPAHSSLTGSI